jgi:ATP-binding cassette subfamily F protein 3
VLSGGERSRLAMIRLLLEPVNLLILDEPTNHLDMPSKDVLKEAIKAFDGTAIIVSHDREFWDGLVTKIYELGGGRVREHLGGIYDFLRSKKISELNELGQADKNAPQFSNQPVANKSMDSDKKTSDSKSVVNPETLSKALDYAERKEQQKRIKRIEKAVKESESKIEKMETRLKELDELLMQPENASDMTLVMEYTSTKKCLDEEMDRWEKLNEELAL